MPAHHRRYAAAALLYAAALAYVLLHWEAIPDPVPVHVDITGTADGFKPKTLMNVAVALLVGAIMSVAAALCVPPRALTRRTVEVTDADPLPFSATAAKRVEALRDATADLVSKLVLAMAGLLSVLNISIVVPDVPMPFWADIALVVAFTVYAVVASIRLAKRGDSLAPDAEEQRRNDLLRYQGGMGTYSEPKDPMAAAVLPSSPDKIAINTAHAPGRRYLWVVALAIVGATAACVAVALA